MMNAKCLRLRALSCSSGVSRPTRRCLRGRAEPESAPTTEVPAAVSKEESKKEYTLKVQADPFKVAEGQLGSVAGASLGLFLRGGSGVFVAGYTPSLGETDASEYTVTSVGGRSLLEKSPLIATFKRPEQPVIVYEFDACPFCKKVREMAAYLDLDILFLPCPQGGPNWRPEAVAKGGKSSFPYMVDPNTGTSMYESDDIIKYLADNYGDGSIPLMLRLGAGTVITAGLASVGRFGKGGRYTPSKLPEEPLILWGYEPSPFTRLVRERLVELELPHILKSVARGSPKRQQMFDEFGKFCSPLLQDPNTSVAMFESSEIVKYLDETYALPSAPAASSPSDVPAETPAAVATPEAPTTPPAST